MPTEGPAFVDQIGINSTISFEVRAKQGVRFEHPSPTTAPFTHEPPPSPPADVGWERTDDGSPAQERGCLARVASALRPSAILDPQSGMHLVWLLLVSTAFSYNAIVIPLRSTFPYQTDASWPLWLTADCSADFVYLLDLLVVKPRMMFLSEGFWVRDPRLTRMNYFRKLQFKMDVLALTPLDLLYFVFGTDCLLLRLPRFLKVQTFWELYDRLDSILMSPYIVRVARTLAYMIYLVHMNACAYYAFSWQEGLGSNGWTYSGEGNAYIRCFYFATKTATSVGKNPRPESEAEYLFMTASWLLGVFVFALLIGQIRDIVATATRTKTEYRRRLDETVDHMRRINLPASIQQRVLLWLTYTAQQHPFDEDHILDSLSQKLRTDVAFNVHINTLRKVQLFDRCDPALLRELVLKLRSVVFLPGDLICKRGEVGKEMYIVKTGQVEVLAPSSSPGSGQVLAVLNEGSVFGEISLLALAGGNRRTADVRARGFSNLFVLSKKDLNETIVYYPDAQEVLREKAEALMRENASRERRESKLRRGSPLSSEISSSDSELDPEAAPAPTSPVPPEVPHLQVTVIDGDDYDYDHDDVIVASESYASSTRAHRSTNPRGDAGDVDGGDTLSDLSCASGVLMDPISLSTSPGQDNGNRPRRASADCNSNDLPSSLSKLQEGLTPVESVQIREPSGENRQSRF